MTPDLHTAGVMIKMQGPMALLVQAELMICDVAALRQVAWHHVVLDACTQASPAAMTAAGSCMPALGPTLIANGMVSRP